MHTHMHRRARICKYIEYSTRAIIRAAKVGFSWLALYILLETLVAASPCCNMLRLFVICL